MRFLALTSVNPATVAYFAALIAGLPAVASAPAEAKVVFVLAAGAASLSWQLVLGAAGATLHHKLPPAARSLDGRRRQRARARARRPDGADRLACLRAMPPVRSRAPLSPRVGEELEPGAPELGSGVRLHDRAIADLAVPGLEARGLSIRASTLAGCDLSGARLSFARSRTPRSTAARSPAS